MNNRERAKTFRRHNANNPKNGFVLFWGDEPVKWVSKLVLNQYQIGTTAVDAKGNERVLTGSQFGQKWEDMARC